MLTNYKVKEQNKQYKIKKMANRPIHIEGLNEDYTLKLLGNGNTIATGELK
jgi:hypothetical protein